MAESTESVRGDKTTREKDQKEIIDWSGRRFVPPRVTSLPAVSTDLIDGEIVVLSKPSGDNEMYLFDFDQQQWVTVGP